MRNIILILMFLVFQPSLFASSKEDPNVLESYYKRCREANAKARNGDVELNRFANETQIEFAFTTLIRAKNLYDLAVSELETVLNEISNIKKKSSSLKNLFNGNSNSLVRYKQTKQAIDSKFIELQPHYLRAVAYREAQQVLQKSREKETIAYKLCSDFRKPSSLKEYEGVTPIVSQIIQTFTESESLARTALEKIIPHQNQSDIDAVNQIVINHQNQIEFWKNELNQLEKHALNRKQGLLQLRESLQQDLLQSQSAGQFYRSLELSHHLCLITTELVEANQLEKQDLADVEKIFQNCFAELEALQVNDVAPTISKEQYQKEEKEKVDAFFKKDFPFIKHNSSYLNYFEELSKNRLLTQPLVIPLDGQQGELEGILLPIGKLLGQYSLQKDIFYRFVIHQQNEPSFLRIRVLENQQLKHEEKIDLKECLHNLSDGMLFILESDHLKKFGLNVRISPFSSENYPFGIIIGAKSSSTNYEFVFSLDHQPLYQLSFYPPLPYLLKELQKPFISEGEKLFSGLDYQFNLPTSFPEVINSNSDPIIDQFVKDLHNDPIAIAQFVQNEIELVDNFQTDMNKVFHPNLIFRDVSTTFSEKRGSAWEQCSLLVYMLRKAGCLVGYLESNEPSKIPADFAERMMGLHLPGEETVLLKYPGVVFFDKGKGISLFPWMKDVIEEEGFDLYSLLPDQYASSDKWLYHYLMNDENIFKLVGTNGDDTAGYLFCRFIENELRKQGLSLEDVGKQRTILKRQYTAWNQFPRPYLEDGFNFSMALENRPELFAKMQIELVSKENPHKKIVTETFPIACYGTKSFPIHFSHYNGGSSLFFKLDDQHKFCLALAPEDKSIQMHVHVVERDQTASKTFEFSKGSEIAFCMHTGSVTSTITSHYANKHFLAKDPEEKLQGLLAFMGMYYFEKCSVAQKKLQELHKTTQNCYLGFGLSKLSPDGSNHDLSLKFPQVDMQQFLHYSHLPCFPFQWKQADYNNLPCAALINADFSANEHQVLREIFNDPYAISTVKLLQLANLENQKKGNEGNGFVTINKYNLPSLALTSLKVQAGSQWKQLEQAFADSSDSVYAYMTPHPISSLDGNALIRPSYTGMATLIFTPSYLVALISDERGVVMNGGFGSCLTKEKLNILTSDQFKIVTGENRFIFKLPTPIDYRPKLDELKDIEFTIYQKAKADVRSAYKFEWNLVADPVDVVSGAFYVDEVDLTLPGPFSIEVRRNYNNQNPAPGLFGMGWKLGFNPELKEEDGKIYASEMDGTVICYTFNSESSRWEVSPEDNPELSSCNQIGISPYQSYIENDNGYILKGADGSKRNFKDNLLQTWTNSNGHLLNFSYEGTKLVKIESDFNSWIRFKHDHQGRIIEAYSQDGRYVRYNYNAKGDLTQVTLPNESKIAYLYDSTHQIITETKPCGRVLENIYDEKRRVIEQRAPVGVFDSMVTNAYFTYFDDSTLVKDALGGCTEYKIYNKQIYKITDPLGHETLQSWFIDSESWFDAISEKIMPWVGEGAYPRSLKSTVDKRGLSTEYRYDEKGNIVEKEVSGEDLTGRGDKSYTINYTYNEHNLKIEEKVLNQRVSVSYQDNNPYLVNRIEEYQDGILTSYKEYTYDDRALLSAQNLSGAITKFKYNDKGFPLEKIELTGTEDPDCISHYQFNSQGQCVRIETAAEVETHDFDIMGNRLCSTKFDANGNQIFVSHCGYNNQNQPIWQLGSDSLEGLYFHYNNAGLLKAKRQKLSCMQEDFSRESAGYAYSLYDYDICGNLCSEVDSRGHYTYYEHDLLKRIISHTKEGITKRFSYEPGGLVSEIIAPDGAITKRLYTSNGLLKEEIDSDGIKYHCFYDFWGRCIEESRDGISSFADYEPLKTVRTYPNGTKEIHEYDLAGNLVRLTDKVGYVWTKTYDHLNRVKEEQDPEGKITRYFYGENSLIKKLPNGEEYHEKYQAGSVVESCVFNSQGELIEHQKIHHFPEESKQVVIKGEQSSVSWFNTLGNVLAIEQGDLKTRFKYDSLGNCIQTIDGEGRKTEQIYDGNQRLIEKILPDQSHCFYSYDENSNLIQYLMPNGVSWNARYDEKGRKLEEYLESQNQTSQRWQYTYSKGLLEHVIDPADQMHTYTYNSLNQLIEKAIGNDKQLFSYDQRGLLESIEEIGDSTSKVLRSYDFAGRLVQEKIFYNDELINQTDQTWEPSGRTLQIGDHKRHFEYEAGRLKQLSSNQFKMDFNYSLSGLLQKKTSPYHQVDISYHQSSLPKEQTLHFQEASYPEQLTWDHSGKLIGQTINSKNKEFAYSEKGSLLSVNEEKYSYDFDKSGIGIRTASANCKALPDGIDAFQQILKEEINGKLLTYTYNSLGQRISSKSSSNSKEFKWDAWGRLKEVREKGYTWKAAYDPFGRRLKTTYISSKGEAQETISYYDPEIEFQEIGVKANGKTFWKLYQGNTCEAVSDGHLNLVLNQDALRNLRSLISADAFYKIEKQPTAYGMIDTKADYSSLLNFAETLSWQSLSLDPTGLIWMGARYYEPQTGRFISRDPVSYPLTTEPYNYANGDPINLHDPSGRFSSAIYEPIKANILNFWNNPRFQGTLQASSGFLEASAGTALASTPFAFFGLVMLSHGADQFATGSYTAITGRYRDTATEMILKKTGVSPEFASFSNNLLSLGGFTGSIGIARKCSYQNGRAISQSAMIASEFSASQFQGLHIEKKFKPFTKLYYRHNLKILTDSCPSKNIHAHHVFPQVFEKMFLEKGLNIHHPKYLTWWEGKSHQSVSRRYNAEWQSFFEVNQGATKEQILEEGKKIMNLYNKEINY